MKRFLKIIFTLLVIIYLVVVSKAFFTDPVRETRFSPDGSLAVIPHAGRVGTTPSDTMFALRHAAEIGVDILELNIHASADGHLVVIHDDTVDRTTNGTGNVNDITAAELISLDAAYYYSPDPEYSNLRDKKKRHSARSLVKKYPMRGKGIRIPLLKEVFEVFPEKRMIIEIKQKEPSISEKFCRMIQSYHRQEDILVGSFHQQAMDEFREACPQVATSTTPREGLIFFLGSKLLLTRAFSPKAVALQFPGYIEFPEVLSFLGGIEAVNSRLVNEAHRKNMTVQVWTVNDPEQMKHYIDLGVDGIMTDYPQRLIDLKNAN